MNILYYTIAIANFYIMSIHNLTISLKITFKNNHILFHE